MSLAAFFEDTAEGYLKWVKDWEDPNPKPVLDEHEGFVVVRDDLLNAGSKIRGIDYIIGHMPEFKDTKEFVFGSCPATGYAQISLPVVCTKYGKKAVLFKAERKKENLHIYQQRIGYLIGFFYLDNS